MVLLMLPPKALIALTALNYNFDIIVQFTKQNVGQNYTTF